MSEETPSIGVAWVEPDRTIIVRLRAEGPGGIVGDANLVFKRRDRRYKKVLEYLGGLKPGEASRLFEWDFALLD